MSQVLAQAPDPTERNMPWRPEAGGAEAWWWPGERGLFPQIGIIRRAQETSRDLENMTFQERLNIREHKKLSLNT